MSPSELRELEWLRREVALAARLDDAGRIAILQDHLCAADAIRRGKSAEDLRREEEARRTLEDAPGKARYLALIERCEAAGLARGESA